MKISDIIEEAKYCYCENKDGEEIYYPTPRIFIYNKATKRLHLFNVYFNFRQVREVSYSSDNFAIVNCTAVGGLNCELVEFFNLFNVFSFKENGELEEFARPNTYWRIELPSDRQGLTAVLLSCVNGINEYVEVAFVDYANTYIINSIESLEFVNEFIDASKRAVDGFSRIDVNISGDNQQVHCFTLYGIGECNPSYQSCRCRK